MAMSERKETIEEKRKAWNFAIGMMQIDGVKPDKEYLELVEKEINGEITLEEMEQIILKSMIGRGDISEGRICGYLYG